MKETYKVTDVLADDSVDYAQAIKANMKTAMRLRKMRDGRLSRLAFTGIVIEAQKWAIAYHKRTGVPYSKLDKVIAEVHDRHIGSTVEIKDYKKCLAG